jgi:autotransporter passenger strand-loop-strand repeat protein
MVISSGGVASNANVYTEWTLSGGTSFNTTLYGGEIVDSAGTSINTSVRGTGTEFVEPGATAIDAIVQGTQNLLDGVSIDTTVVTGGSEFVSSGSTSLGTTLLSRGNETVSSSGTAIFTVVSSGGSEIIASGGTAISATVSSGGTEIVSGTDIIATVSGGGSEIIRVGGLAVSTTVLSGGVTSIDGGVGRYAVVNSSGTELISGIGSVASGTTLIGGTEIVTSEDAAIGTNVGGQGYQIVSSGGLARQTIVSSGTEAVLSGGTAIHTTLDAGGTVIVNGVASNSIIAGGTLDILSGGTAAGVITFTGSGTLIINGTTMPLTTISGFAVSDTIDLAGIAYSDSGTAAFNSSTDILTVTEGGSSYQLTLAGAASDSFDISQDSGSGSFVTISSVINTGGIPCFAAGTLILTDRGEIAIEALAIGDRVITDDGAAEPIQWIGHRHIACNRHAAPGTVWPVRVEAHAFGPAAPHRALLLSPDHAILAAGVLIPVKHLINGTTIHQLRRSEVTYFHIQLARHTAILANGLPAETYLDTGDRGSFANAPGPIALHPAFGSERGDVSLIMDALGYAPFRVTGSEIEAVRARLADIAMDGARTG